MSYMLGGAIVSVTESDLQYDHYPSTPRFDVGIR